MQPSLEKLHKYFKLESERGYDNKAVVGGLDKILNSWESEARADNLPENTVQVVSKTLREYPSLEPDQRSDQLRELWRTIQPGYRGVVQRQKQRQTPPKLAPQPTAPVVKKVEEPAARQPAPAVERPQFHSPPGI